MKKSLCLFACLFAIILLLSVPDLKAQTGDEMSAVSKRAAEGDTVWVLLNHVKYDKRQQFENFIEETFWPKAADLNAGDQMAFNQTRVLYPAEMNGDSTYTYIFIMDPAISGEDYSVSKFLTKMYGEEKAAEYLKTFEDWYASPQIRYVLLQTKW